VTALVAVETVLLVLLVVLVAGLLRSHAEILRRLGPAGPDGAASPVPAPPTAAGTRPRGTPPAPIMGTSPAGDVLALDLAGAGAGEGAGEGAGGGEGAAEPTLLAFLTSGCTTCQGFWDTLSEPRLPSGVRTVIVTRGADSESPSRIGKLAPEGIPVVMSSEAWRDYQIPGAPYFVLADGEVRGEGAATTWQALAALVTDAVEDGRSENADARGRDIDRVFAAAGIGPEDPSLYPAGRPGDQEG
jgi:hypothetical protein